MMQPSNPVTLWHRRDKDKDGNYVWNFNHLEDGHCLNDEPTPKFPSQKTAWAGCKWRAEHAQLVDNKVVHLTPNQGI